MSKTMSYNGITKCAHCNFVSFTNKECINDNLLAECNKCKKITYSCNGTCIPHSSTIITYLKHKDKTNQSLIRK